MKNICKNIIITISILSFIILIFSNRSYASGYDNFKSFNNAPRKEFIVSSDKLTDITVKIRDNDKISSVKLYTVDSKGNKKRTPYTYKDQSNNKEHIYKMSHKTMLKGKTTHFYLKVKDGTGNIFNSEYIVSVKNKTVNGKKVQYYAVNDAPRIINWNISGNKVTFEARDLGGVKSVKVQDINNGNKTIQTYSNLPAGSNKVSFDLNKCKEASDKYKLKIITTDIYNLEATRTVYFKKKETNTTNSNSNNTNTTTPTNNNNSNNTNTTTPTNNNNSNNTNTTTPTNNNNSNNTNTTSNNNNSNNTKVNLPTNIKLDRNILMLDKDHYNVATLQATVTPSNATDKTVIWTSSNTNIATVDAKGNIKAKKAGTVTITAKTSNGKTAKCSLKVITHMTKVSKGTSGAVAGKINTKGYWLVKKEKFSTEQIESYVNNAEMLCKTGDYKKYPESEAAKLPVYKNGTGGKTTINKKQGLSANNYLILTTTTNQKIYIFEKQNGVWKKIKEGNVSSGWYSNGGHNRFDFYLGAIYQCEGSMQIHEFWQCKSPKGRHLDGTSIVEPHSSHRSLHKGPIYNNGAPSSAGCIHIPSKIHSYICNNRSKLWGTRIIVY